MLFNLQDKTYRMYVCVYLKIKRYKNLRDLVELGLEMSAIHAQILQKQNYGVGWVGWVGRGGGGINLYTDGYVVHKVSQKSWFDASWFYHSQ